MAEYKNHSTGEDISIPDAILTAENENPRAVPRRSKVAKAPPPSARSQKPVTIVCITENRPWIEVEEDDEDGRRGINLRPMQFKERATVAEWVADLLVANNHAIRV